MQEQDTVENNHPEIDAIKTTKKLSLEQWLKLGGFILALVGTIITVLKFTGTDTPKKLTQEQKETYTKVSEVIGELITQNDSIDNNTAIEFYKLYNGRMVLVEDSAVSRAMRRFKFELDDKRNGVDNILNPNKFQKTGIEVIETCKNALEE